MGLDEWRVVLCIEEYLQDLDEVLQQNEHVDQEYAEEAVVERYSEFEAGGLQRKLLGNCDPVKACPLWICIHDMREVGTGLFHLFLDLHQVLHLLELSVQLSFLFSSGLYQGITTLLGVDTVTDDAVLLLTNQGIIFADIGNYDPVTLLVLGGLRIHGFLPSCFALCVILHFNVTLYQVFDVLNTFPQLTIALKIVELIPISLQLIIVRVRIEFYLAVIIHSLVYACLR